VDVWRNVMGRLPDLSLVVMAWLGDSNARAAAKMEMKERRASSSTASASEDKKSLVHKLANRTCDGCGKIHSSKEGTYLVHFDRVGLDDEEAPTKMVRFCKAGRYEHGDTGNPLCRLRYKTEAAKLYGFGVVKDVLDDVQAIDVVYKANPHYKSAAPSTLINDAMGQLLGDQWVACGRRVANMNTTDLVAERQAMCRRIRRHRLIVNALEYEYESHPSTAAYRKEKEEEKKEKEDKKRAAAGKRLAHVKAQVESGELSLEDGTLEDPLLLKRLEGVSYNRALEVAKQLSAERQAKREAIAREEAATARRAAAESRRAAAASEESQDPRDVRDFRVSLAKETGFCVCMNTPSVVCANGGCKTCCKEFQARHPTFTCQRHPVRDDGDYELRRLTTGTTPSDALFAWYERNKL